ncbi:hypothetical protein IKQ21_06945 [bacterium]|nr:hypothetical protein [bacterium]
MASNAIGAANFANYYNDPYFRAAFASPNVNFRGGSQYIAQNDATTVANPYAAYDTTTGVTVPQTSFAATEAEESNSNTGLLTAGALALLMIGAGAIGYKNGSGKGLKRIADGWKNIWKKVTGSAAKADGSTQKITAVFGKDGKVSHYLHPEHRTGNLEFDKLGEYGLSPKADELFYNPSKSIVNRFNVNGYEVKMVDGKIAEINKDGKNVLSELISAEAGSQEEALYKGIQNIQTSLGKEAKDIEAKVMDGVTDINYTNISGDTTYNLTLLKYNGETRFDNFTTLKRLLPNCPELKKLEISEAEQALFTNDFINGKLFEGANIRFNPEIGGKICHFDGKKLVGISEKGSKEILEENTVGYKTFVENHQKELEDYVKNSLEKNTIPAESKVTI